MSWPAGVKIYPDAVHVRHPAPLDALRAEIGRRRAAGAQRIGLIGFSAGGHLAGLAALAPGAAPDERVQFAVLGYAITSMETETYRPARLILLGEDASPQLRRSASLDALVTPASPPFFGWHTAEDAYAAGVIVIALAPHEGHIAAMYLLGAEVVGALWYLLYLRSRIVSRSAGIYREEVVELEKLSASSPAIR